jgi:hypothetical protein
LSEADWSAPTTDFEASDQQLPQGEDTGVFKTTSMAGFYYKAGTKINSSKEEIRAALSEHAETVGRSTPPRGPRQ